MYVRVDRVLVVVAFLLGPVVLVIMVVAVTVLADLVDALDVPGLERAERPAAVAPPGVRAGAARAAEGRESLFGVPPLELALNTLLEGES